MSDSSEGHFRRQYRAERGGFRQLCLVEATFAGTSRADLAELLEPFRDLLCAALDGDLPAGPVNVEGVGVVTDPAAALAAGRDLLRLVRAGRGNTDEAAGCLRALSGLSG